MFKGFVVAPDLCSQNSRVLSWHLISAPKTETQGDIRGELSIFQSMEEAKAAAYYDELLHKGEGAARFKQGLGYSSQTSQQPTNKSNTQSSLSNFVRAASPGRAAEIKKEICVENIRDKLKKKDEKVLEPQNRGDIVNCRLMRREGREDSTVEKERQRSPSGRLKGRSHERNTRYSRRRSSRSSSPYDDHRRHVSSSPRRDSTHHGKGRHRRNISERNRSISSEGSSEDSHCQYHRRGRHRSSSSSSREVYDSGFTSKRRRRQGRSFSGSEEGDHSPSYSRRRGRSRSPAYRRDRAARRKGKIRRSSSHRRKRTKKEHSPSPHRNRGRNERSFGREENKKEELVRRIANIKEKGPDIDYSKLINGYESMTPAERVKAKMRLQLSETIVKDYNKGIGGEWERFDFNKEAPLDDDAKLDYFGDDTGAKDDTGFLRNTGTTFFSSACQANKEAQIKAAHEAAIFGTCMQPSSDTSNLKAKYENAFGSDQENMVGMIKTNAMEEGMIKNNEMEDKSSKGNVLGNGVISEQVYAKQQGSWRDRARKLREERVDTAKS